jgi:hypothetical protein
MNAFYSKLVLFAINHLKPDSMATSALHVRWLIPNAFGTLPAELPGSNCKRIFFISNYDRFCQSMGNSVTYFAVRSPTSMVL